MKKHLLTIAILCSIAAQAQQTTKDPECSLFYGGMNLGYSNYGIAAEASLNYQQSNGLFSLAYYQSHLCYTGDYNGIPFPDLGSDEHHMAIRSLSLSRGFLIGKKRSSVFSIGLSVSKFDFEETATEHDELSMSGFWEAITGSDKDHEVISSRSHVVMGIPVSYRWQFGGQHAIGWEAGIKVDLNPEKVFVAATLGIRFGRSK